MSNKENQVLDNNEKQLWIVSNYQCHDVTIIVNQKV